MFKELQINFINRNVEYIKNILQTNISVMFLLPQLNYCILSLKESPKDNT